jgi:hypothetical protein
MGEGESSKISVLTFGSKAGFMGSVWQIEGQYSGWHKNMENSGSRARVSED